MICAWVPLLGGWSIFDVSSRHRFPKGWKPRLLTLPGGHTRGANPANPGGSDSFTRDLVPPDALWLHQSLANRLVPKLGVYQLGVFLAIQPIQAINSVSRTRRTATPR